MSDGVGVAIRFEAEYSAVLIEVSGFFSLNESRGFSLKLFTTAYVLNSCVLSNNDHVSISSDAI
jgi:hypothetical protein